MNVFENDCLMSIVGVSRLNHIKMDDVKGWTWILNEITNIIKKKRLKCFGHEVRKGNANYVNYS